MNYSIFLFLGVRLIRLPTENVQNKTSTINILSSINKNLNQLETNRLFSTVLSSSWKSTEGIINKYTPIAPSNIKLVFCN